MASLMLRWLSPLAPAVRRAGNAGRTGSWRVMLCLGDMARRGSLYALACAEDSRTEAFDALRVPARMLGVRNGGLGVKVSLLGKEVMLASQCLGTQETPFGGMPYASVCHAATVTRLGRSVADVSMRSIKEPPECACLAREFKITGLPGPDGWLAVKKRCRCLQIAIQ
jgi:hypothetical protein